MRFLGVDLAWGEGSAAKPARRSGVVALDEHGRVLDARWTIGLAETADWMHAWGTAPAVAFVDAPLVIANATGQRDGVYGELVRKTGLSRDSRRRVELAVGAAVA